MPVEEKIIGQWDGFTPEDEDAPGAWEDHEAAREQYDCAEDQLEEGLKEWLEGDDGEDMVFYAEGRNMGWQHRSGYRYFSLYNKQGQVKRNARAVLLLRAILPDTDCHWTVTLVKPDDGRQPFLHLKVSHHDAPTGEFYDVYTVAPPKPGEKVWMGKGRWVEVPADVEDQLELLDTDAANWRFAFTDEGDEDWSWLDVVPVDVDKRTWRNGWVEAPS